MRIEWKIRFALLAFTLVCIIGMVLMFRTPSEKTEEAVNLDEIEEYEFHDELDISEREGFVSELVDVYEKYTGKEIKADKKYLFDTEIENLPKAVSIGLIDENDNAFYLGSEGVSLQDSAVLIYKIMCMADSSFEITDEEALHILNDEYNNSVLDEDAKTAYAFLLKHRLMPNNFVENPLLPLAKENMEIIFDNIQKVFCPDIELETGTKTVVVGESNASLIKKLGNPNRIDENEYGFEWYVYNSDYSDFVMVGVDGGVVCAFFTNSDKASVGDIKIGMDMSALAEKENFAFYSNEETKQLDAVLYNPYTSSDSISAETQNSQGLELLDMLNAYRKKNKQAIFIRNADLEREAYENSKRLLEGNSVWGAADELASLSGSDIFACYEEMLSLRYSQIWEFSVDTSACTGIGVSRGEGRVFVTMCANTDEKLSPVIPETVEPKKKEYPLIASGKASVLSPVDGDLLKSGEDVLLKFGGKGAEKYHIDIINCESRDYIVNTDITGDTAEYSIDADRFDSGIDYEIGVKGYMSGAEVLDYTALISYGEAEEIEILSPTSEHILTGEEVTVMWRSELYTDFQIDLYNKTSELIASSRIIDKTQTDVSGLSQGEYTLKVSAMRRDTNIVKTVSEMPFEIKKESQVTLVPEKSSVVFETNKYSAVFGNGLAVYTSKAQADANMVTIEIPVWKIGSDGKKYASTAKLTINRAIANEVMQIFTEIFEGPEKFPIKSVGGYNWRNTATGGKSQHSYGTCIDINPAENYCIYNTGKRIGSFWKPYENPYSIAPDGDVVNVFRSYGWTWGGDWNSLKDYMHFSYLGG